MPGIPVDLEIYDHIQYIYVTLNRRENSGWLFVGVAWLPHVFGSQFSMASNLIIRQTDTSWQREDIECKWQVAHILAALFEGSNTEKAFEWLIHLSLMIQAQLYDNTRQDKVQEKKSPQYVPKQRVTRRKIHWNGHLLGQASSSCHSEDVRKNSVEAASPSMGIHAILPPAGGASAKKDTVREKLRPKASACTNEEGDVWAVCSTRARE